MIEPGLRTGRAAVLILVERCWVYGMGSGAAARSTTATGWGLITGGAGLAVDVITGGTYASKAYDVKVLAHLRALFPALAIVCQAGGDWDAADGQVRFEFALTPAPRYRGAERSRQRRGCGRSVYRGVGGHYGQYPPHPS